jgi:hypothetical protein
MNDSDQNAKTKDPTWFLLYEGTSEDGRGPGKYIGRTTDKTVAFNHCKTQEENPYATGGVVAITDTKQISMSVKYRSVFSTDWEEL